MGQMNGNGIFMTREAGTPSHKNPHTQYVLHTEEDTDRQQTWAKKKSEKLFVNEERLV